MGCEVTTGVLLTVLKSWEQKGIVKIISNNLGHSTIREIALTLCEAAERGRKGIESLEQRSLTQSVRSQIELVYRCENIIGENPVLVSISKQRILKLGIKDPMDKLPQREREIIRFRLFAYTLRLSNELREKYEHKT